MAKPTTRNDHTIDKLLEERAQFITWIGRLSSATDANPALPDAVRSKVRGDYEGRLQSVVEALRSHQTGLEDQLAEFEARRDALTTREVEAKERLSEAEVRHMVGEYDDGRWQNIRGDLMRELVAVREELGRTISEIDRLNEVLETIRTPVEVEPEPEPEPPPPVAIAPPPPPPPAPAPPAAPVAVSVAVPPEPAPASAAPSNEIPFKAPGSPPKPQPKAPAKPKDESGRTLWFPSGKPNEAAPKMDELAFLKSVSDTVAPPKRPSGGFAKAVDPAPAAAPPAPPDGSGGARPSDSKDRPSTMAPKTLKCGECGTMNRPTEWYCERCGAELAAL